MVFGSVDARRWLRIKRLPRDRERIHTRIRISDGGPNHLKLADLALHTSKQKVLSHKVLPSKTFEPLASHVLAHNRLTG